MTQDDKQVTGNVLGKEEGEVDEAYEEDGPKTAFVDETERSYNQDDEDYYAQRAWQPQFDQEYYHEEQVETLESFDLFNEPRYGWEFRATPEPFQEEEEQVIEQVQVLGSGEEASLEAPAKVINKKRKRAAAALDMIGDPVVGVCYSAKSKRLRRRVFSIRLAGVDAMELVAEENVRFEALLEKSVVGGKRR